MLTLVRDQEAAVLAAGKFMVSDGGLAAAPDRRAGPILLLQRLARERPSPGSLLSPMRSGSCGLSLLSWTREPGPPSLWVSSRGEEGREQLVRQVTGSRAKEAACTWVRVLGAEHTEPVWGAHPLPTSLALSRCPTPTPSALKCFLPRTGSRAPWAFCSPAV